MIIAGIVGFILVLLVVRSLTSPKRCANCGHKTPRRDIWKGRGGSYWKCRDCWRSSNYGG